MEKNNKIFKYLCCFNSLSAKKIEILLIICSSIGAILTIIGFGVIHWKYTEKAMKVFYILSFIFFLLLIIIPSFFLYTRNKHQIHLLDKNSSLNKTCVLLCYIAIFLSFFSIIIQIIIAIGVLPDLRKYNKEKENNNSNLIISNPDEQGDALVSDGELIFAFISIIINLFIWIINFLLYISAYLRISYCIVGSYWKYLTEKKEGENYCKNLDLIVTSNNLEYPKYKKEEEKLSEKIVEKKEKVQNEPLSCKINNDNTYINKFDSEQKNILKYSYKERLKNNSIRQGKNCNSVDNIHKSKNENIDKEKYFDKYLEGYGANPFYSNFGNKSILNVSTTNNSINPGNSVN